MEFIYKGKRCFGNKINVLFEILEENGIELTHEEFDEVMNLVITDEVPQFYYTDGLLDLDKIKKDPEAVYDWIKK